MDEQETIIPLTAAAILVRPAVVPCVGHAHVALYIVVVVGDLQYHVIIGVD